MAKLKSTLSDTDKSGACMRMWPNHSPASLGMRLHADESVTQLENVLAHRRPQEENKQNKNNGKRAQTNMKHEELES